MTLEQMVRNGLTLDEITEEFNVIQDKVKKEQEQKEMQQDAIENVIDAVLVYCDTLGLEMDNKTIDNLIEGLRKELVNIGKIARNGKIKVNTSGNLDVGTLRLMRDILRI